ncbi:NucA/NucB deoxyribonuclease domain-containing protein [Kitasatospora sp. NBC_01300]|uniref:NucA/NucB deoxyribonuclease domain-containing protein n=1 Tax=Kitasatospora sp. NBC_01300 TaxID=2903574 RepID=UPI00352D96EE|nr:NucA/NucB deoxyribonuclease domain-containing protein [Kitasatospora sp. NBC_01300]
MRILLSRSGTLRLLTSVIASAALLMTSTQAVQATPVRDTYTIQMADAAHPMPIGTHVGTREEAASAVAAAAQPSTAAVSPTAPPSAALAAAIDAPTLADCRSLFPTGPANATTTRFGSCFVATCGFYTIVDGAVAGLTKYRCTVAGQAKRSGSRTVTAQVGFDNFSFEGVTAPSALVVGWTSTGSGNPACLIQENGISPTSSQQWQDGQTMSVTAYDNADVLTDVEKTSRCNLQVQAHSDIPTWGAITNVNVRLDQAPYLNRNAGSVFTDHVNVMDRYAISGSAGTVARHILWAQENWVWTRPQKTDGDKVIPGSIHSAIPLTRLAPGAGAAQQDRYNRNRSVVGAMCTQYFGQLADDLQCDEYPFASTWEGAAKDDNNYSIMPVNKTDNLSAGGTLSAWYANERILDKDPFFVDIAD